MTIEEYQDMLDSSTGLCRACGAHRECTEPDARKYKCEECDKLEVYGLEELVIMGELDID